MNPRRVGPTPWPAKIPSDVEAQIQPKPQQKPKKMKNFILLSSLAIVASFSPPTVAPYVTRNPLRAATDMPPPVGEFGTPLAALSIGGSNGSIVALKRSQTFVGEGSGNFKHKGKVWESFSGRLG